MTAIFSAFIYPIYADDRYMADRIALTMFYVYILALPFYLFLNVRVTGDVIPGMETLAYDLTPEIRNWFVQIDPFTNECSPAHRHAIRNMASLREVGREMGGGTGFHGTFLLHFPHCIQHSVPRHPLDIRRAGRSHHSPFCRSSADKTREGVWGVFDERLIGRRFALLVDNPRLALRKMRRIIQRTVEPYRQAFQKTNFCRDRHSSLPNNHNTGLRRHTSVIPVGRRGSPIRGYRRRRMDDRN